MTVATFKLFSFLLILSTCKTFAKPPFSFFSMAATLQENFSGACNNESNAKTISEELENEVVALFEESKSLPISLTKDDGNIEVRTKFRGEHFISMAEAKIVTNRRPEEYLGFLENFNDAFAQVDPMVKGVHQLEKGNHREGIKAFLKFPFPVADRVMLHYKYLKLNRNKDEHMMILSEKDNENLLEKYFTSEEKKKYVLGKIFICAYWVRPVTDEKNKTVGSNLRYIFSGDVGGSMPKWVQSSVGPKNALDSLKGFIGYGRKKD